MISFTGIFEVRMREANDTAQLITAGITSPNTGTYGGTLTLPPMPDFRLAEIVQELADSGAGVVELIRHTKSLEDIFLSLTESTQEVREK